MDSTKWVPVQKWVPSTKWVSSVSTSGDIFSYIRGSRQHVCKHISFTLKEATAVNCAETLVEEVFLRYGLPRRLISDNGPQFISVVMQQICNFLEIKQDLIPVYHPQANPSEGKHRDLKPRLVILVGDEHISWEEKLPLIRFSMNTTKCETTNHTAAFLQFGRGLRTADDVTHDSISNDLPV
ncbi:uncharacterized protein K02A2.6-like [Stegodyphus dumicola]|uniref:uncharacterized protein K02A2.6-like n=1 Tax=Stegodyphus dumicola TaxID=202533 RepID=UPI0015B01F47|nr:uncharacterized protein K02A2.6-like [Stegodyphus dumicola]